MSVRVVKKRDSKKYSDTTVEVAHSWRTERENMFNQKEYMKQYYLDHCEQMKKNHRQWQKDNHKHCNEYKKQFYKDNPEYTKRHNEYQEQWYKENREYRIQCAEQWRINNPEKIRVIAKRIKNKRKRNLGFNPLNEYFKGSASHHINWNDIIYMPIKIHQSIFHCLETGRNMEKINKLAMAYMAD